MTQQMTSEARGLVLMERYELVVDAIQSLAERAAPERARELTTLLSDLRELCNHDVDVMHCDSNCPAWYVGAYCGACGGQHDPELVDSS
jgi:CO dehydrogenase/acetyl-CoA synthase alpha subunit